MDRKQQIKKANKRISVYNRAVDQARAAGNMKAAAEFNESLHKARMERMALGNDNT
jgi:hypothetical protein